MHREALTGNGTGKRTARENYADIKEENTTEKDGLWKNLNRGDGLKEDGEN